MAALPLLALMSVIAACRTPPPAPSRLIRFKTTRATARLDSGLRVLVIEDHGTNLVQLGIRLDVGSASDPPGKAGLAHLVEHLLFNLHGPDGRTAGARLAAVALRSTAHTSWGWTLYVTTARPDQLDHVVAAEVQRFSAGCRGISRETLAREREVVANERLVREDLRLTGWMALLAQVVPADHPYARPVGGSEREVAGLTLDDVCGFLDAHYRPDRMVVVLSGDIAAGPAAARIASGFAALVGRSTGPPPRYPRIPPGRRVVRSDRLFGEDRAVVVAWPLPPAHGGDGAASTLAVALLEAELRSHRSGWDVHAIDDPLAPLAMAVFELSPTDGKPEVDDALAELRRAVAGTSREHSRRALRLLVDRRMQALFSAFDELGSRVDLLGRALQTGGRDDPFGDELRALGRLEPVDVGRAAARLFSDRTAVILEVDPRTPATTGAARHVVAPGPGAFHDDSWAAPADPAEADHELRVPLPRSTLDRAERFRLPNGLEVVLLATRSAPLASAQLIFAGGSADDPPDQAGLAAIAAVGLQLSPSRDVSDTDTGLLLYWLGENLQSGAGRDYTVFSTTGLAAHLDTSLAGLAWLVKLGEYRTATLDGFSAQRAARSRMLRSPRGWKERLLLLHASIDRAVYGPAHPYARAASSWDRNARPISLADVQDVRRRRFGARNGLLVITGAFDPALARAHARYWFDDLRPGEPLRSARPPPPPRSTRLVIEEVSHPADVTALIRVVYPTGADQGRRAARLVLGRILHERLLSVRQTLGASYSLQAAHEERRGSGQFIVGAIVDPRRFSEALVAILGDLAMLRGGGAAGLAESFVRARREALYALLAEESGAESAADRIASVLRGGGRLDSQARLAREIMKLTAADVVALIASELAPTNEIVGLMAPRPALDAARAAAGLSDAAAPR